MLFNAVRSLLARPAPERPGIAPTWLRVEPLEDRVVPATYWWVGSLPSPITHQVNLSWSSPANWASTAKPGSLPTAGDTVIFSTTDPHAPRRVINPNSILDATFGGGTISALRIDPGYTGSVVVNKNLTVTDSFTQAGGTVTGGATLTLHRTVVWYGGTMAGAGTTLIDGTEALGLGPNSQIGALPVALDHRQLVIDASAGVLFGGQNGTANVTLKNGASIVNQGNSVLMSAPGGGLATITAVNGQGAFWNCGTLQVGLGAARPTQGPPSQGVTPAALAPLVTFRLSAPFNDLGSVVVEPNAWLWVSGGGSSDGTFTTVASSRAQVGNVLFTGQGATTSTWDGATFQGPGSVFLAGSAAVAGRTLAQNFTFLAGQLSLGSMAVNSTFRWLSGTMTGSGIFVLNPGATGQVGFPGTATALALLPPTVSGPLSGVLTSTAPTLAQSAVFSSAGAIVMQSAAGGNGLLLSGNAASHFDNGGTFTIQDTSGIGGGTGAVFNNLSGATFQRANPGLSPSTVAVAFDNAGNKVPGGGIIFKSLLQNDAAAQLDLNGETITGLAPLAIQAGLVVGSGTLVGGVSNGGTMLPGGAGLPGLLAINGGWNEQTGGAVGIDIDGTTPVTGYDQVSATGFVSLAGALNVSLNGYVPQPGDTFQILSLPGGYTGTFASVNLPPAFGPGGAYDFQLVYGSSAVSLAVVPASGSAPSVGGISLAAGAAGTTVTIVGSNFGDATAVTFGVMPALSFVVVDASHIVAVVPPNAVGTYDIRVSNSLGMSPRGAADQFTYGPVAPPVLAAQAMMLIATAGQPFSGTVAWFTAPVPGATPGSFTVTIKWGNGQTTAGSVQGTTSSNLFRVVGGSSYALSGTYQASITISDSNGHSTTVTATIVVFGPGGSLPGGP
jgi:hypothetical protein